MSDTLKSWRDDAQREYAAKRNVLTCDVDLERQSVNKLQSELDRKQASLRAKEAAIKELDRAAEVFGLTAIEDGPVDAPGGEDREEEGVGVFKDLALKALRQAFPNPLRAVEIQDQVQRVTGRSFHKKTAGMTLYRLSKEKLARRSGWDWFFVPEDQRNTLNVDEVAPMD